MGILRGMNCLMVEVFIELLLVKAELQNVMLALQNKSAQNIIKDPGRDPLYKPIIRYVPLQRVWFSFRFFRFGLKTGIDFDHFGLESGMIFEETKEVHERITNKREREICEFDVKFKKCFLLAF